MTQSHISATVTKTTDEQNTEQTTLDVAAVAVRKTYGQPLIRVLRIEKQVQLLLYYVKIEIITLWYINSVNNTILNIMITLCQF